MSAPPPRRETIVLVEDDRGLADLIRERLEGEGFAVLHETDGLRACELIRGRRPDLVVLDIMLPGMDGFQVCRQVRPAYSGPILILTARDDDLDQILGLELGADDYVNKPVKPRVLLARIRALLRRSRAEPPSSPVRRIVLGPLMVDASRREATVGEALLSLSTVEFDVLWHLVEHAGQVVSRQDLYRAIYNYDYDGLDRTIDVYISRLRQKLGDDPASPHYIKTVRGVGYLLAGEKP
ncbi:MAG: response regulator transcription factor [Candidatus Latescibacterota bacterium]|jgi:two-component system response regulator RstA